MEQNKQVINRTIQIQSTDFRQKHEDNSMEKGKCFQKRWCWKKKLDTICKQIDLDTDLTCLKKKPKIDHRPNCKIQSYKTTRYTEEYLCGQGFDEDFDILKA